MNKGFCLIECIIVCILLALTAAIAVPSLRFLGAHASALEAEHIRMVCLHAQQQAIISGTQQIITFDSQNNKYTYNAYTHTLPKGVTFGTFAGVKGPPSAPTHEIRSPITFPHNTVVITPNGFIQPGSIYVVDQSRKLLYAVTAPIAGISYMRLYRYNAHEWTLIP